MIGTRLDGVALRGLRVAVPATIRSLEDEGLIDSEADRARLAKSIGINSRHVARPGLCTSDLCQLAAEGLLDQLGWARDGIDVLLFVSQSADYVIPATACALQARLGLGSCMAFDINLGCSGYAYGLWTAASLLKTLQIRGRPARALVLAGDISTSKLMPGDRGTIPLFGDAGSATALEVDRDAGAIHGLFGTDGTGAEHLIIRAGGVRQPLVPPVVPHPPEVQEQLFKDARLHLNGTEVFNFTLRQVPALIEGILAEAGITADDVDYFLFHQANAFMLTHLRKKARLPEDKVPLALETYGNTSSASIPLTIASRLANALQTPKRLILMGFGVGWSWGAVKIDVGPIPPPAIVEYV
ncbi:MAG TPA: ketoacyl-ACP synthase III [Aliidongia sp.]|uniref:3-oxoacyl-ACP synthase III family protein n=1 Tax=Aliidongia sp. TaxID=1914230 RepID=UPI002DDD1B55|nr:ketoacyl-ACP synthase III [Aliidongia sp.]HEV2673295.1 ketoacyl-ACP synthase III [Aliidongia sp.]